MIQAIVNNPYRILGLYVNSDKDTISKRCKTLLSNPHFRCETDFDIKGLPAPDRTTDSVTAAYLSITSALVISSYVFFWFNKPKDNNAVELLNVGDLSKADDLFFGSLDNHNIMISYFLTDDIYNATVQFHEITKYSISEEEYGVQIFGTDYIKTGFKNILCSERNYDVKQIISLHWRDTFTRYDLPRIKSLIKKDNVVTYEQAINDIVTNCNIQVLQEYGDKNNVSIRKTLDNLVLLFIEWMQQYLLKSQDLMKYSFACSRFKTIQQVCPNVLIRCYLSFAIEGSNETSHFIIESEKFNTANGFVLNLLNLFESGQLRPIHYIKVLEDYSSLIADIKSKWSGHGLIYSYFANVTSVLGMLSVRNLISQYPTNLNGMTSDEIRCSFISLMYMNLIGVDKKSLPENYSSLLEDTRKIIYGLLHTDSVSHHILLPDNTSITIDASLFLTENVVFDKYTNSIFGCNSYLKRFPNGPHAQEVKKKLCEMESNSTKNNPLKNPAFKPVSEAKLSQSKVSEPKNNKPNYSENDWLTFKPILKTFVFMLIISILFGNYVMTCVGCVLGLIFFIVAILENFNNNSFYKVRLVLSIFIMVLSIIGLNYLS